MQNIPETLRQVYVDAMPNLAGICERYEGVSGPLLLSVPDGYERANVRIMIVGQQTYGWPCIKVGLNKLLQTYEDFDLGVSYKRSPFWQASHQLFTNLNPNGPERAFLWSNLVKVDQHGSRPEPGLEDDVSQLGLLGMELQILKPHAVVFFTGPNYDDRLRRTFPGVEYRELSSEVVELKHPDLPAKSFRTYHPKYLWMRRKREALDRIVERIQVA